MSKEEWDAWIRLMPQIRIKFVKRTGNGGGLLFVGEGCIGDGHAGPNLGPAIYGRLAVLREANGHETDLLVSELTDSIEARSTVYNERVHVPGLSSDGLFIGVDFVGSSYLDASEKEAQLLTLALNHEYNHRSSKLTLSSIEPGLEPIDARYERDSDIGDGSVLFFVSDFIGQFGECIVTDNIEAQRMLADRIYLHDPNVATPMMLGLSFVGYDRMGIEPNTARLMVDVHRKESGMELFIDDGFIDDKYLTEHDDTLEDRALRGIAAAKALRDQIHVSFATERPVLGGDYISPDRSLSEPIRNYV
jgi:hypothetical protein